MKTPSIIVQARTGSSRMPSKMLADFFDGKSLLEVILRRIKMECPNINIIVATSSLLNDLPIVEMAQKIGLNYYCGSQNDVLSRFVNAAHQFEVDKIIRLCADNPFIDTDAINILAQKLEQNPSVDYIAYCTSQKVPTIKTHYGFWAEGVTISALEKVARLTEDPLYHEHVTNYIYAHADLFKMMLINIDDKIEENQKVRLTVDTVQDFDNLKTLYKILAEQNISLTPQNIIKFLDSNPKFYSSMIEQIKQNSK